MTDGKTLPLLQRTVVEILSKQGGVLPFTILDEEYQKARLYRDGSVRRPLAILCDAGLVKEISLFVSDSSLTDAEYEALQAWSTDGDGSWLLYVLAEDV